MPILIAAFMLLSDSAHACIPKAYVFHNVSLNGLGQAQRITPNAEEEKPEQFQIRRGDAIELVAGSAEDVDYRLYAKLVARAFSEHGNRSKYEVSEIQESSNTPDHKKVRAEQKYWVEIYTPNANDVSVHQLPATAACGSVSKVVRQ